MFHTEEGRDQNIILGLLDQFQGSRVPLGTSVVIGGIGGFMGGDAQLIHPLGHIQSFLFKRLESTCGEQEISMRSIGMMRTKFRREMNVRMIGEYTREVHMIESHARA